MKKFVLLTLLVAVVLVGSAPVLASSFELSVLGVLGTENSFEIDSSKLETQDLGFAVNAGAELYPNVVVEGSFAQANAQKHKDTNDEYVELTGEKFSTSVLTAGAKYRVYAQDDVAVYAGVGWGSVQLSAQEETNNKWEDTLKLTAAHAYLKAGVEFTLSPEVSFSGGVSFLPKAKFSGEMGGADLEDAEGTVLAGNGSIVYSINDMFGVQAGVYHTSAKAAEASFKATPAVDFEISTSSTLYGAGLVVNF